MTASPHIPAFLASLFNGFIQGPEGDAHRKRDFAVLFHKCTDAVNGCEHQNGFVHAGDLGRTTQPGFQVREFPQRDAHAYSLLSDRFRHERSLRAALIATQEDYLLTIYA